MAFKIYTKTGDEGETSLLGGTRVPKSHLRIESYGTVDELNAHIGMLIDLTTSFPAHGLLSEIQDRLFTIGSSLATDPERELKMSIPDLRVADLEVLEKEIDRMTAALPEMKHFIIPGGHVAVSQAHIARCVCRRAERICVHLHEVGSFVDPLVIKYLNRLSDYLFVLSRYLGMQLQVAEVPWRPRKS